MQIQKIRFRHFSTLVRLIYQSLKKVDNWPEYLSQDIRARLRLPVIPNRNEIRLRKGLSFEIYPDSGGLYHVFADIFLFSCYERQAGFSIGTEDTVIDIGANVGFFTAKAAAAATRGRVLAFEPLKPHFDMLKVNLSKNNLGNVTPLKEAVWGANGEVEIKYSYDKSPLHTSMYDIGGNLSELVSAVTLDHVFEREQIDQCDFLKLDCEGAEYEILLNASKTVMGSIKRIALEWHRFDPSHDPRKLAGFLDQHGFSVIPPKNWNTRTGYLFASRP